METQNTQKIAPVVYIEDRVLELMKEAEEGRYAKVKEGLWLNYGPGDFDDCADFEGYWINCDNGHVSQDKLRFQDICEELSDFLIDEYQN